MKADSAPITSRNRNAFYNYRKRPSPSPSVCSSASSSIPSGSASYNASASAAASSASRSRAAALAGRKRCYSGDGSKGSALGVQARSHQLKRSDSLPPAVVLSSGNGKEKAVETREFEALLEREYQEDVLAYMAEMEDLTNASVELIDQQPELAWYMRPYLIDFLVEIHSQYRLRPETLYLAVNIADRYTSKRIVYKRHYQLVGCAALWIAAKFEDAKDRVPTVQDLCSMVCGAYDASAFIQMEGHVLSTLNWLIGHPTAEAWLRVASISDPSMLSSNTQHVARFLMEITLFHRAFVPLKSSEIALGCLLLARYITGKPRKTADETQIAVQIAQMLDGHLAEHLEQLSTIVLKKYSLPCFGDVSTLVRSWYLAGNKFDLFSWPSQIPISTFASSATLTPSYPLRRDSSFSSIMSGSPSSSSHYNGSSSDDEDLPLTPSTPLTQYGSDEADPMSVKRSSPLARHVMQYNQNAPEATQRQKGFTPPTAPSAAGLSVKLVPTSGPAMTLC